MQSDYARIGKEFRDEYPGAPVGTPKFRSTLDEDGNTWMWGAKDAAHFQIEPEITRQTGLRVNQNGYFDEVKKLDDAFAARQARAVEQGFDVDNVTYRGLYQEYDADKAGNYQMFTRSPEDAGEFGNNVVPAYLKKGNNLSVNGGGNNFNSIPVGQLPKEVRSNLHPSITNVARTDDIAYAAQKAGYDSVSIGNVHDNALGEIPTKPLAARNEPLSQDILDILDDFEASGFDLDGPNYVPPPEIPRNYDPTTIDIVFDPKNIRSTNAMFDPAKADSSDLLAGIATAAPAVGLGALAAGGSQDAEASFIGTAAKNWDEFAHALAVKMKDAGVSRKEIWQKTGIDLDNVDGLPRSEIDDSGMTTIPKSQWSFGNGEDFSFNGGAAGGVDDFVRHDGLENSYDGLIGFGDGDQRTTMRIQNNPGSNGFYNPETDTISVRARKSVDGDWYPDESVTAHELTHAIQEREGFAVGGSPDSFLKQKQRQRDSFYEKIKYYNDEMREIVRQKDMAKELGDSERVAFLDGRYNEAMGKTKYRSFFA